MYNELCSYENLLSAYRKARKGKTRKHYVKKFEKKRDEKLLRLRDELLSKTYKPRELKTFIIRDPKTRKISKSAFRDRVIHHTLINIIGPIFEKGFIYDSHANQIGKGSFKAIERFNTFKRKVSKNNTRECYCLKADIKHYFEEVDHEVLLEILQRKINDENVIWLIQQVLDNNAVHRGGGRTTKRYAPWQSYLSILC
jgi:retron-type reverse transcriptase